MKRTWQGTQDLSENKIYHFTMKANLGSQKMIRGGITNISSMLQPSKKAYSQRILEAQFNYVTDKDWLKF